jgi:hypothetical protein
MSKQVLVAALGFALELAGCSTSFYSSSSGCSGPTTCANGAGVMQACYTEDTTGACSTLDYQVGSRTFPCVSCDDQVYCLNAALVACGVPDASIPADADLPDGVVLGSDGGSTDGSHD